MDKKLSREVLLHGLLIGEIRVIRDESQRVGEGEHQEEEYETLLSTAHTFGIRLTSSTNLSARLTSLQQS